MAAGFKTATVNASDVPSTQTDFPVYVDLSRLGITTLAEAQSVRVYADSSKTTEWAREIVSATEMHVKIPSLTSTTAIYVDWDGVRSDYAVTDTYGRNAVWSDYNGVYHLNDTSDSTSGGYTLTNAGSVAFNSGVIGDGSDVGASNVNEALYRQENAPCGLTLTQFQSEWRISSWVNFYSNSGFTVFHALQASNGTTLAQARLANYLNRFHVTFFDGTSNLYDTGDSISTTTDYYVVMSYDGTNIKVFVNGSEALSQARSIGGGGGTQWGTYCFHAWRTSSSINDDCPCQIDEARIGSNYKDGNWELTEYNNQSDESGFWGTWSDVGGGAVRNPTVSWWT